MAKRRHFISSHLPFKLEPRPPAADFRPVAEASLRNVFRRITEKKTNGNTNIYVLPPTESVISAARNPPCLFPALSQEGRRVPSG